MQTFDDNKAGYLKWVASNPNGFVINAPKQSDSFPYMLHRANCSHITTDRHTNYTTTDFKKICSLNRQELVEWGTNDSSDFQECKHCKP